jgi:hypothetical protein
VGFESGDYLHLVVKDTSGKEHTFFVPDTLSVKYFLAEHKGQSIQLTYQIVDSYIPEAAGIERIEAVKSAKFGALTVTAWWKQISAKNTLAQLKRKVREADRSVHTSALKLGERHGAPAGLKLTKKRQPEQRKNEEVYVQ